MSVAELKNTLHRMVVETDDPQVLAQITAIFATLRGEEDWWDVLSDEEKRKIEIGAADAEAGDTNSYDEVKERVRGLLGNR